MATISSSVHKDTRQSLINAGIEVFGMGGYNGATTRQIAKTAGVNLAAIPYYFGGKEELYRAVIESIVDSIVERTTKVMAEKSSRIQWDDITDDELIDLALEYVSIFAGFLDLEENAAIKLIISREQIVPSGAFSLFYENLAKPQYEMFGKIIGKLMKCDPTDAAVTIQAHSIVSMIIFFSTARASLLMQLNTEKLTREHITIIQKTAENNTRTILKGLCRPE